MTAADQGGPGPDHYQLLGVARGASREEIAQAWRRRARAEHPDRRPGSSGQDPGNATDPDSGRGPGLLIRCSCWPARRAGHARNAHVPGRPDQQAIRKPVRQ